MFLGPPSGLGIEQERSKPAFFWKLFLGQDEEELETCVLGKQLLVKVNAQDRSKPLGLETIS